MSRIAGNANLTSVGVLSATIYLQRTDGVLAAPQTTTSAANGDFEFTGLDAGTYHVYAEYEVGGVKYRAESTGFITITAFNPDTTYSENVRAWLNAESTATLTTRFVDPTTFVVTAGPFGDNATGSFTNATELTQPTLVNNGQGNQVIRFTKDDEQWLNDNDMNTYVGGATAAYTLIIAVPSTDVVGTPNNNQAIVATRSTGASAGLIINRGAGDWDIRIGGDSIATLTATDRFYLTLVVDRDAGTLKYIYNDGEIITPATALGLGTSGGNFTIAALGGGGSSHLSGDLAELILISETLSNDDMIAAHEYIKRHEAV